MSKPGIHVQVENRDPNYDARIIAMQPAGMTLVCSLRSWVWVKGMADACPHTRFLIRITEGEEERKSRIGNADLIDEANKFANLAWRFFPDGERTKYAPRFYFQPWDEWGYEYDPPDRPANEAHEEFERLSTWLDLYDYTAIEAFQKLGLCYAAINYSEGNPPLPPWNILNGWTLRVRTLAKINEVGPKVAIAQLHTYGYGKGMFEAADAHLFRIFSLEDFCTVNDWHNVYIGIGEDGKDNPSFADTFDGYVPAGHIQRPADMTPFQAYTSDYIAWDRILCQSIHWRILFHNWYTLDMIPDGYEVADRPQIVGRRVVDIHPLFGDYEKYIFGVEADPERGIEGIPPSPPVYELDDILGGGVIVVPPPTPPNGEPRPGKYVTTGSVNIRPAPKAVGTPWGSINADQPVPIEKFVTGLEYKGNSWWGKLAGFDLYVSAFFLKPA